MKQTFHHYDAQGRPRDVFGNLIENAVAQDGQSIRVPLVLMDEAQRAIAQENQTMHDAKTIQLTMTPKAVEAAINKHLPGYKLAPDGEGPAGEAEASDSYMDGLADAEQDALRQQERILATGYQDSAPSTGDAAAEYEAQLNNGWM